MWYSKYMKILGRDDSADNDALYHEISESIEALAHDRPIEVSVVVIAYNEQERLAACLWSLSQTVSRWAIEVIVVDNNSTDRTAQIIRRCGARYVFQPLQGVGNARQAGLEAARGAIILSADADTFYPPTYADVMIGELQNPRVSCVFTTYWFFEDGKKKHLSLSLYSRLRDFELWLRAQKRPELAVGGAAMAFRREDALKVGWRRDIRRGEDGSMLLGLKSFGKVKIVLRREVRVRSTSRTLDADGSMRQVIGKRIAREAKRLCAYCSGKASYKDESYNKIE